MIYVQHVWVEEAVPQRYRFIHDAEACVHPQQRPSDQGMAEPESGGGELIQDARVASFVIWRRDAS